MGCSTPGHIMPHLVTLPPPTRPPPPLPGSSSCTDGLLAFTGPPASAPGGGLPRSRSRSRSRSRTSLAGHVHRGLSDGWEVGDPEGGGEGWEAGGTDNDDDEDLDAISRSAAVAAAAAVVAPPSAFAATR